MASIGSALHLSSTQRTTRRLGAVAAAFPALGVLWLFLYAVFGASSGGVRTLAVGALVSLASLGTGCLVGFLFGIPKIVSSGELRHRTTASRASGTPVRRAVTTTTASSREQDSTVTGAAGESVGTAESATVQLRTDSEQVGPDASAGRTAGSYLPSSNLAEVSDWLTKLLLGAGLVELTQLGGPASSLVDAVATGLERGTVTAAARAVAASLLVAFSITGFLSGYVVTTMWYQRALEGLE